MLSQQQQTSAHSAAKKKNELFTGNWVLCRVRKCVFLLFFSRKQSPLPELCESRRKLRVKMKYAFSYSARPSSSITRRNNRAFSISFHLPHRVSSAVNQIFSSQSGGRGAWEEPIFLGLIRDFAHLRKKKKILAACTKREACKVKEGSNPIFRAFDFFWGVAAPRCRPVGWGGIACILLLTFSSW